MLGAKTKCSINPENQSKWPPLRMCFIRVSHVVQDHPSFRATVSKDSSESMIPRIAALFFVLSRRLRNSISGSLGWRHSLYYSLVATRTSQAHSCLVSMVHGFGGAAHFMPLPVPCTHGFPSSLRNASIELRTCSFCAVIKAVEISCLMQYK